MPGAAAVLRPAAVLHTLGRRRARVGEPPRTAATPRTAGARNARHRACTQSENERNRHDRHRHRPRNHQQLHGSRPGQPARDNPQRRRRAHHPLGRGVHEGRRAPGGHRRPAPGRHEPGAHRHVGQAPHGQRLEHHRGRPELLGPTAFGHAAAQAAHRCRALPRPSRVRRGHNRARLLHRRPAPSHQGRGRHRRAQRAAHHQRAHGRRAGLRTTWAAARSTCPSSR